MFDVNSIGKTLILLGAVLAAIGVVLMLGGKLSWFGRLPGDIMIQKKGLSFYFPVTTSILISIILSVLLFLFSRR